MKAAILFIDSDHAKIFRLNPGMMEKTELKKHEIKHHLTDDKKNEEHEKHFFHEVASELKGTTELLIVGPGLARTRFKTHLDAHHHTDLAKSVVGTESIDHPTDPQIVEVGRKFFKAYDLFH